MDFYYSPEKFGLEVFDEISRNLSYSFDIIVVYKNKEGKLFWAQDNGCSCPSPFENQGLDDLTELKEIEIMDFETHVRDWNDDGGEEREELSRIHQFIQGIKDHFKSIK